MGKPPMPSMLARMLEAQHGTQQSFPVKEAQRDMLRQALDLSNREGLTFNKGDPVHYLNGMGPLTTKAKAGMIFAFWRYLDPENYCDHLKVQEAGEESRETLPDIDCLIAYFNGQAIMFVVSCSWLLLPGDAPPGEEANDG